jgi:hypothetical protein
MLKNIRQVSGARAFLVFEHKNSRQVALHLFANPLHLDE